MQSKHDEANLMWEAYSNPMDDDFEEDFGLDDGFEDDGFEDEMSGAVVMEMEPPAPLSPVTDDEMTEILRTELKKLAEYGQRLNDLCGKADFDPWMVAKVVKASDYVSDVWHRLDAAGVDYANTGFEQAGPEQDLNF
jgi:hypothetical protein